MRFATEPEGIPAIWMAVAHGPGPAGTVSSNVCRLSPVGDVTTSCALAPVGTLRRVMVTVHGGVSDAPPLGMGVGVGAGVTPGAEVGVGVGTGVGAGVGATPGVGVGVGGGGGYVAVGGTYGVGVAVGG